MGRSAQERLFGSASKSLSPDDNQEDLYTTNKLLNTVEGKRALAGSGGSGSNVNSLERHDMINHHHHPQVIEF